MLHINAQSIVFLSRLKEDWILSRLGLRVLWTVGATIHKKQRDHNLEISSTIIFDLQVELQIIDIEGSSFLRTFKIAYYWPSCVYASKYKNQVQNQAKMLSEKLKLNAWVY